jgi:N-methylhydantoinase B
VPHNSPYVLLGFTSIGNFADPTQSLDGAYPPAFEAGGGEIVRGLNLTEVFQKGKVPQSSQELHKLAEQSGGKIELVRTPLPATPMATDRDVAVSSFGGAKGMGDPLDREPERILADIDNKVYSLEMSRRVFGVVIDLKTMKVDLKATEAARNEIKANRRKKGAIWGGKK